MAEQKKMKKQNYRHGDVILVFMKEKIELSGAKKMNHRILAWGEVTGHKHEVKGDEEKISLLEKDGVFYLVVEDKEACVIHEEHGKGEILPGIYKVIIQQDWEPDGWRNVSD